MTSTVYTGWADILSNFYTPLSSRLESDNVEDRLHTEAKRNKRRLREYAHLQGRAVQPVLRMLLAQYKIIGKDMLARGIRRLAVKELKSLCEHQRAVGATRHIVFLVPPYKSDAQLPSGVIALLWLLRALILPRRRDRVTTWLQDLRHVHVATSLGDAVKSLASGQSAQRWVVVLLEDTLYKGATGVNRLRGVSQELLKLQHGSPSAGRGGAEVHIWCPFATNEALMNCKDEATEMQASLADVVVHIATLQEGRLRTLFEGMSSAAVLGMDVFSVSLDGTNADTESYMFHVLHLDDRHSLYVMPHKLDDMAMVPHTLLHTLPDFPGRHPMGTRAVMHLQFASARRADAWIAKRGLPSRSLGGYSDHARIAVEVCSWVSGKVAAQKMSRILRYMRIVDNAVQPLPQKPATTTTHAAGSMETSSGQHRDDTLYQKYLSQFL